MPRDFQRQLKRQIDFLSRSCDSYDAGEEDEAIRIAVALRVLFHQTSNSTSLLTHLGEPAISLVSTAEPDTLRLLQLPLIYCAMEMDSRLYTSIPRGRPRQYRPQLVSLKRWWDDDIIFAAKVLNQQSLEPMTRHQLVSAAANKDGGAHVDEKLKYEYDQMERGAGLILDIDTKEGAHLSLPLPNAHLATLRQIAEEVFMSEEFLALQGNHRGADRKPMRDPTNAPRFRHALFIRWCRETRVWGRASPITGESLSSSDAGYVQAQMRLLMNDAARIAAGTP